MPRFTPAVEKVFDWLVDGAPGCGDAVKVISKLLPDLREAGVPIDRFSAFVKSLHPAVFARSFQWEPGAAVVVREWLWADTRMPQYHASVVKKLYDEPVEVRCRLGQSEEVPYTDVNGIKALGFTDYVALPLKFMSGASNVTAYATKAPGGFSDEHVEALRQITRALSRVAETLVLMRNAVNLLNTYVGRDAGERILKGHIQRGDTESISCVIWFSDLRGFTSLSSERTPMEVINVLNQLFDCQVPAIEANGGQVLKFIGDGMLAIFPIDAKVSVGQAGDKALDATVQAYAALDALNVKRAAEGQPTLRFGVALHVGEVGYGNIGGANRLDFTAIGPAVNLASRLEGLTGKLEKRVLVSEALGKELSSRIEPVGEFELKGVAQKQKVFQPA
jgi:adenylate cyclase